MSLALGQRPADLRAGGGGVPARRAVVRWAWRLFRREWREQLLVLALLSVAVAAAIFGASAAYNAAPSRDSEFGTADEIIELHVVSAQALQTDLAALKASYGAIDVIGHRTVPIPGSIQTVDLRTQDPRGVYGAPMLALRQGRYPTTADEVAITDGVGSTFHVRVDDRLSLDGVGRTVVGLVENPGNLGDEFALMAPSQGPPPQSVSVLLGPPRQVLSRDAALLPSGDPYDSRHRGQTEKTTAAALVLVLDAVVMLLVCLVATAGFAVIAQRRLRQLGMLAAIGATMRHLRLVVLANGLVVGVIAAVVGSVTALAAWILLGPLLEASVGHRIGRFDVPWWLIGAGMLLAIATATAAAWWPARAAARIPITQALSARPPRPRPARRSAAAAAVLLVIGFSCLAVGIDTVKDTANPLLLISGVMAIVAGLLLISPLAVRALAATASRLPVAARLAWRDLGRYQARSGAALAAISLGLGIAVAAVVIAGATRYTAGEGNLSNRQLLLRVGDASVIPERTPDELRALQADVDRFVATLADGAAALSLDAAVDPNIRETDRGEGVRPAIHMGRRISANSSRDLGVIYVATPELLDQLGVDLASVSPDTDLLTGATGALRVITPGEINRLSIPKIRTISAPAYSSAPSSFITSTGLRRGGWQTKRAGWLVETSKPLTNGELADARHMAAQAGLTVETRNNQTGLAAIRSGATAAGMLLALSILAMTIGLIRSEAHRELQTLTATGATRSTRRTLTGATAAGLALLGVGLGTASAYIALIAAYVHDLDRLSRVPLLELGIIIIGLPVVAAVAGWLLSGREPPVLARHALE